MANKSRYALAASLFALACPMPALAQDAAETAVILSSTGQGTGSASRSMGSAVSGSLNRAAAEIQGVRGGARGGGGRRGGGGVRLGHEVGEGPDALEGTDAPAYRMESGATIRVSGGLRRPASAGTCSGDCQPQPAATTPDQ